jgi:hypothetical protein
LQDRDPRPRGVDGEALTKTGGLERALQFYSTGRAIRTAILPKCGRFMIGLNNVLPNRKALPQP